MAQNNFKHRNLKKVGTDSLSVHPNGKTRRDKAVPPYLGTVSASGQPKVFPMRRVFGEHLVRLGGKIPNLVVLDADVSFSTQTKLFAAAYPDRFVNCGIAEANMVSVAAGMAAAGLRPVVSSFAFLLATRALDQVRSQVAYAKLPVVLAGGYCGLSDFADGGSHQSVMDISLFSAMPNMTVICPADAAETEMALEAALEYNGPVYLRLSRAEVARLPCSAPFTIGRALVRREGKDVALIATGHIMGRTLEAGDILASQNIQARIIDLHTVKPLDTEIILQSARECGAIVTCEENTVIGGMGSLVASFLAGKLPTPMRMIGIQDSFGQSGKYQELQEHYGLTARHIVDAARDVLKDKRK